MVFIPIQAVRERPVHWLPSKLACGDRQLWKMTAENMLLHDVRRFRKDEANLIPIPMEDEAREHF
ncbi:hypothetical protein E4V51_08545 [Paenibacillus sp. 28ISP30-2]|nr:hypothetical protein ASL14_15795 [Paenibacillus sp. IHB B 3084]MBE0339654.1 hypothetical protein [Paenibacillus sp. 23TSA30-6]MBE0341262.1 hypothetical protein [Paenibacillus sp. 28ISP30-2]